MAAREYRLSRSHPFNPSELLRELRQLPVSKVTLDDGSEVWAVTRHEDVVAVLRDPRFSSDVGYHKLSSADTKKLVAWYHTSSLGHMDGPGHLRIRQVLAAGFMPKQVDALRPIVERIARTCVDRLLELGSPIDLHNMFSMPVAGKVVPATLGMPETYCRAIDDYMALLEPLQESNPGSRQEASPAQVKERYTAAIVDLYYLCEELLKEHEGTGDNIFTQLQHAVKDGQLSYHEASGVITNVTTIGHSISASSVTLSALMMMLNPALARAIREKDETVPRALEELLRYHSPMNWGLPRAATEDVLMGRSLIRKGDRVMVSLPSANRDESVFSDPDEFDTNREDARRHVTFGAGPHVCLAQWLARAEVEISISELATRIPTLQLAVPLEDISFAEEAYIFMVKELPVTW
jgi:cytochrome P450